MTGTFDSAKKFWEESGSTFPSDSRVTPTSRDPYLAELEEDNIIAYLDNSYDTLEIGCGDASHTVKYARYVKTVAGIDISSSLVEIARKRIASLGISNINLAVVSAMDMGELYAPSTFDCIISQRVLINLPTWELQQRAISLAHRLLRVNGILIITEGFQDEPDNINQVRRALGLDNIVTVNYNYNLRSKRFDAFINKSFAVIDTRDYGLYLLLSRVFHPLAVSPAAPKHDSVLNYIAMNLSRTVHPSGLRKYSYNLFYVLKKAR